MVSLSDRNVMWKPLHKNAAKIILLNNVALWYRYILSPNVPREIFQKQLFVFVNKHQKCTCITFRLRQIWSICKFFWFYVTFLELASRQVIPFCSLSNVSKMKIKNELGFTLNYLQTHKMLIWREICKTKKWCKIVSYLETCVVLIGWGKACLNAINPNSQWIFSPSHSLIRGHMGLQKMCKLVLLWARLRWKFEDSDADFQPSTFLASQLSPFLFGSVESTSPLFRILKTKMAVEGGSEEPSVSSAVETEPLLSLFL